MTEPKRIGELLAGQGGFSADSEFPSVRAVARLKPLYAKCLEGEITMAEYKRLLDQICDEEFAKDNKPEPIPF